MKRTNQNRRGKARRNAAVAPRRRQLRQRRVGGRVYRPMGAPVFRPAGRRQATRGGLGFMKRAGNFLRGARNVVRDGLGAASAIGQIMGSGDYSIKSNTLLSSGGPPAFGSIKSGFRIRHREYITDINSSIAFATQVLALNPGLSTTFPWLSQVANQFETYKFHGVVFYLNSTSATAVSSTNTALGVWGIVTQYDPTDDAFVNKQQCENYQGAQACVPSGSLIHGIECAPQTNPLDMYYVRAGAPPTGEDLKFYDIGTTQIFTQGSQASSNIGELWISYDIEFFKPKIQEYGPVLAYSDVFTITPTATQALGATNYLPSSGSNIGTSTTFSNQRLGFPSYAPIGYYLVVHLCTAASGAATGATLVADGTGMLGVNWGPGNVPNYIAPAGATSNFSMAAGVFQKVSTVSGYVTSSGFAMTVPTAATLFVTLINEDTVGRLKKLVQHHKAMSLEDLTAEFYKYMCISQQPSLINSLLIQKNKSELTSPFEIEMDY